MITDTCQRWNGGREARRPAGELIRTSAYDVEPIESAKVAKGFVEEHHYAGTASSVAHRFGLYLRGSLVGVALFGPPPSMNAHNAVWPTLAIDQAVSLGRLVLLDEVPGNGESWFISRCFELLASPKLYRPLNKDGSPRRPIIGVESCADPEPRTTAAGDRIFRGHLGIVYQATNGRYVGRTDPASLWLLPDGTCFSKKSSCKISTADRGRAYAEQQLVRWGAEPMKPGEDPKAWLRFWRARVTRPMRHRGNHRYLWCLDRRRRREVLSAPSRPYPKNDR